MEKYKSEICPTCINNNCKNNIKKCTYKNTIIIKCEDYMRNKTDKKIYLQKYINDLKMRKIRNDY